MQQISGDLVNHTVLIKKPKDVGRLYTKSRFGTPLSGNVLRLSLLEAVFLCGEQKLQVYSKKKPVSFADLVHLATEEIPRFELLYLAYRDLRKRGHFVSQINGNSLVSFHVNAEKKDIPTADVLVCSERDDFSMADLLTLHSSIHDHLLWIALIDEEGDITYYSVSLQSIEGKISSIQYPPGKAYLLDNRVVVFDNTLADLLHKREFYGKPFGNGLQVSLVEALYLAHLGILTIYSKTDKKKIPYKQLESVFQQIQPDILTRLQVFTDLKHRQLLVKTGFKFGTHFRVYTQDPNKIHAEYLVHVVPSSFTALWSEISRGVRLAHSVNKEFLFACITENTIMYVSLGRLRP